MPTVSEFAGSALLHQGGSFEPQRKSNFALVIYGLDDAETLVLALKSSSVPNPAVNVQGIKYFNETMKYAGSVTPFADQTAVYHDYIDRQVLPVLSSWFKSVWCPETGSIGWAKDYKKRADIFLLPPGMPGGGCPGSVDAQAFRNRVWKIEGIFPSSLDYDDLDHDDDGTNAMVNMTFSIDRAYPQQMGS